MEIQKMIDPKSLRIGNYFRMRGGKMVQTVFEILDNTDRGRIKFDSEEHYVMYSHLIMCRENRNQYKPWEIEGIPLSEQELIRLGFHKTMDQWTTSYRYGSRLLMKDKDGLRDYGSGVILKFVHTIQNLYYSLTGTELTYKVENVLTPTEPET